MKHSTAAYKETIILLQYLVFLNILRLLLNYEKKGKKSLFSDSTEIISSIETVLSKEQFTSVLLDIHKEQLLVLKKRLIEDHLYLVEEENKKEQKKIMKIKEAQYAQTKILISEESMQDYDFIK